MSSKDHKGVEVAWRTRESIKRSEWANVTYGFPYFQQFVVSGLELEEIEREAARFIQAMINYHMAMEYNDRSAGHYTGPSGRSVIPSRDLSMGFTWKLYRDRYQIILRMHGAAMTTFHFSSERLAKDLEKEALLIFEQFLQPCGCQQCEAQQS